jgi:tetratricopeptide (TPR) repeat protein
MDEYDNALRIVEEGLKKTPQILLSYQKVQILIKKQEWEDALSLIEELSTTSLDDAILLRFKYWIYIDKWYYGIKNPESTLEMINTAIKLSPDDKELLILKSLFYCKIDRFREAKQFLIKEIDINALKKNPKIDTAVYFILASSYVSRGKFDKALKIANQVLELYPNHPLSFLTKALVFGYNLIYKFKFQEPNIETFKGLIQRAISLDIKKSHKAKYLDFQGYVLLNVKDYEGAINAINNAIEILPNNIYQYLVKIYFLTSSKRDSEALELIEEYVKKYPKFKQSLYIRKSVIYWGKKQFDKSYEVINELSKLYPKSIDITNNKALFLANLNRKEEAIKTVEHLITIAPNQGNSFDTYGEILQISGEYEEAIKKYEEALKIEPTGWSIDQTFTKMGVCYEELGMYEHALESYKTGKILEERKTPTYREFYGTKADKRISELRAKIKKLNNENGV